MRAASLVIVLALAGASVAGAATYDVGPGQPLASIGAVPWASLAPGDVVNIHWRPQPYREKWVIGRSGTPAQPIVVRGVPGPAGELPIIDGANAVTAPGLNYWSEVRGILKIGGSNTPPDSVPEWIVIEGLDFRGANAASTFTDDGGANQTYQSNASGIYLEKGRNIVVRGCWFHDCGNGFFIASSPTVASQDILVEGCRIWDNGNVGSLFEHNNYTAAIGLTFQFNWFGPPKAGANGNNLKDRSAGLVVRWNWIEGGNRQLDLVDAEDSSLIQTNAAYRDTHVYGNVLIEREADGNRQILHYGGDSGTTAQYRKGTLWFFNNTVVSYRTDRTTLMRLSTNEERCVALSNIVYTASAPGTTLALLDADGRLEWSHQWTRPGWVDTFGTLTGTIVDDGTSLTGPNPGFVDEPGQDFHLAAGSACADAGAALPPGLLPAHDVTTQYGKHQGSEPRPRDASLDIGAYELSSCLIGPPAIVTDLRVTRAGLAWSGGADATAWDVVQGSLAGLHAAGLAGSSPACALDDTAVAVAPDSGAPPPGGRYFLVRAENCAGSGTWDSGDAAQRAGRDGALAAICP